MNGDWVSPSHPIQDGDTIEVVTGSSPLEADLDLEIRCKTPRARIAINRKLQQKRFNNARETGRQILQQELRRNNLPPDVLEGDQMHFVLEILNVKDLGDLYARVGQDLLSPRVITYYLAPSRIQEPEKNPPRFPKTHNKFERYLVEVRDLDRAVHKFARCCSPHPGQAEVVLTLSERGITFHKNDCRDLYDRHGLQPQELFDVAWGSGSPWKRPHIFCVLIAQETVRSVLTRLTDLPEGIQILSTGVHLNRRDEPMVRVKVRLRDYDDARAFFESIPADRSAIEDFWWESDVKRLREARNDTLSVASE
jgi:GTP pyrophosphokinase